MKNNNSCHQDKQNRIAGKIHKAPWTKIALCLALVMTHTSIASAGRWMFVVPTDHVSGSRQSDDGQSPVVEEPWVPTRELQGGFYSPENQNTYPPFLNEMEPIEHGQFTGNLNHDERTVLSVGGSGTATQSGTIGLQLQWVPSLEDLPGTLPTNKVCVLLQSNVEKHLYWQGSTRPLINDPSTSQVGNGLGSPVVSTVEDIYGNNNPPDTDTFGCDFRTIATGTKLYVINNPDHNPILDVAPPLTIESSISVQNLPGDPHGNVYGNNDPQSVTALLYPSFSLKVVEPKFEVKVRRHSSDPNVSTAFASETRIAAGAMDSDEHIADIEVTMTPAVAGIEIPFIPRLRLDNGILLNASTRFHQADASVRTTDANGKAVIGTFSSGHYTTPGWRSPIRPPQPIKIILPLGKGLVNNPQAKVTQVWDQYNEWKSGTTGEQLFDPYINFDEATPFTFKPAFNPALLSTEPPSRVPITQHTMNFLVTKAQIAKWNEGTEEYDTKVFTTDAAAAAAPGSGMSYNDDLSRFAFFPNDAATVTVGDTTDEPGAYRSSLKVPYNINRITESITVTAEDEGTYKAP